MGDPLGGGDSGGGRRLPSLLDRHASQGDRFTWHYSGKGSNGQNWFNANSTVQGVRGAILASFLDQTAGAPKDSNGVACSTLQLVESPLGGTTVRLNTNDGLNTEGIFVSSSSDPIYQYLQGGAVAFAAPHPDDQGYVADCDTVYNAVSAPLATNGSTSAIDIQSIAQQETAHCFGMHHVCRQTFGDGMPSCNSPGVDRDSIMYPFAAMGIGTRNPDQRDQDNICQIYPVNGVGKPCDKYSSQTQTGFTVADCQLGTQCACTSVGSICTATCGALGGTCPAGSTCDTTNHCAPDFYPGTANIGPLMRTAADCGGSTGRAAVSSPCNTDADCGTGMVCLTRAPGGYCTIDCTATGGSGGSCPAGSACFNAVLTPTDAYCLKTCTLTSGTCSTSQCRTGLACQYTGSGPYGACWIACRQTSDCDPSSPPSQFCNTTNGLCYRAGGSPYCSGPTTRSCTQVGCPSDQACDPVSGACTRPSAPDAGTPAPDAGVPGTDAGGNTGGSTPRGGASGCPQGATCAVEEPAGCGCAVGGGLWALPLLALLLVRRRRAWR